MQSVKVLIVEDNGIVAEDIRMKLKRLGYPEADVATSFDQAIHAVKMTRPDIALLDIQLGAGKDGVDVAHVLRRQFQVPVVYLTAYSDQETISRAKLTEPYGYILKPFDEKELSTALEIALYKSQIEQRLKASEQWYKTTLTSIGDGVIATDMSGCVKFLNPVAESLTGWSNAAAAGKPLEEVFRIVNELTGEPCENPVAKVIEAGQIVGLANHTELISKTGIRVPIKDSGAPILLNDTEALGVVLVFQDNSEHKKAEEAIQRSEAKYRSMMESMNDPVYVCSSDFTIEYLNPAMQKRIGADVVGENCHKAIHGLNDRCEWCVYGERFDTGPIETDVLSPLDNRHYRVQHVPITNTDGSVSKMTIFHDITDYLNALAEKEKAQHQLILAQKMESIGTLAGGIAHDFNNILTSIIGFTELVLDETERGTSAEDSLQEIYAAGKRAKELVRQILAFARQSEAEVKPIRVDTIIEEVAHFIRSSIPTTISVHHKADADARIMGNSTQVHQILMNLCTNSAFAMEEHGGVLEIYMRAVTIDAPPEKQSSELQPGDYIEIKVSDTGKGIPPEILDSIFEPYFTTKGPGEGTGMGLAVVHGIVESYGGWIVVDSVLGRGTTFTIYLPTTSGQRRQPDYVLEALPTGSERILFVDDEVPIAKMGQRILEQLGYAVTTRTSSEEALALFQSRSGDFDLVITDMTMPQMTGDLLAREMMRIRPDLRVILCTGYSKKITHASTTALGIKALVHKPIVRVELATTIRKVLDGNFKALPQSPGPREILN